MDGEDIELLRDYVTNRSEPAFRALVERHIDMVYATALRQVHDAHLAQEVTQAVFIALARKAHSLSPATILAGWLFRAAQFAGARAKRTEARRKHWEQQAAQMEPNTSDGESAWDRIAPHVNDALNQLKEADRAAIILRFFESKSIAQVGSALGTGESATKMRIARALEQLRGIFQARGIVLPIALLTAALSSSATHATPAGLAASISTAALLKQTAIPLLTKGTLLLMTWNNRKTAIAAIVMLLLCSATTGVLIHHFIKPPRTEEPAVRNAPELTFTAEMEPGDRLIEAPVERRVLRIVKSDGSVVISTNDVDTLVVVDGDQTNSVTVLPADGGPRTIRRFRARPAAVRLEAGAEYSPRENTPVPAPPAPQPQ